MLVLPGRDGATGTMHEDSEPAMNTGDTLFHISALIQANPGATFALTADKWFVVAAIVILWMYVMLAPGRESVEA
jgi:hypothetical protein